VVGLRFDDEQGMTIIRFPIRSGALWTGRGFGLGRDQQSISEAPQYHTVEKEGKVSTKNSS